MPLPFDYGCVDGAFERLSASVRVCLSVASITVTVTVTDYLFVYTD
jgi:hypothetical protein